ncbi:MAG: response regulator transcription factor [Candidatus Promineifilaceae bacterium]
MVDPETVTPSILLVDDDDGLLKVGGFIIRRAGYDARPVSSAEEALQSIQRHGLPHLAVVDISMPGMNGIDLCHKLKSLGELPIIMLTAQSQESVIVNALQEFADDYIVKPFQGKELVARIRRVLRRTEDFDYTFNHTTQRKTPFQFDYRTREISEGNKKVSLTPTEAKLLYYLMNNPGFVHNQILLDSLWPTKHVPTERLRVHVSRLRTKLQSLPSNKDYILTERGRGYCFQVQ